MGRSLLSFSATNAKGAPKHILVLQAIIVSVLGCFYLIFPNPSAAFYLLSAMTVGSIISSCTYLCTPQRSGYTTATPIQNAISVFLVECWGCGRSQEQGSWLCYLRWWLRFFPPTQVPVGSPALYTAMVALGLVVFGGGPFCYPGLQEAELDAARRGRRKSARYRMSGREGGWRAMSGPGPRRGRVIREPAMPKLAPPIGRPTPRPRHAPACRHEESTE